jgi:hypothetical protein
MTMLFAALVMIGLAVAIALCGLLIKLRRAMPEFLDIWRGFLNDSLKWRTDAMKQLGEIIEGYESAFDRVGDRMNELELEVKKLRSEFEEEVKARLTEKVAQARRKR